MFSALRRIVPRMRQYSQPARPKFNSVSMLSPTQIMDMIETGKPADFDGYNFFEPIKTNDEIRAECNNFLQYSKIMGAICGRLRRVPRAHAAKYICLHISGAIFCASTGHIFINYVVTSPYDMHLTIAVTPVWLALSVLQGAIFAIVWPIFPAVLLIGLLMMAAFNIADKQKNDEQNI